MTEDPGRTRRRAWKAAFTASVCGAQGAAVLASGHDVLSPGAAAGVTAHGAAVHGAVLAPLFFYIKSERTLDILAAAAAAASVLSSAGVAADEFQAQGGAWTALTTAGLWVGVWAVLAGDPGTNRWLKRGCAAAVLLAGAAVWGAVHENGGTDGTAGWKSAAPETTGEFKTQPNLYFISFDSFTPEQYLKERLELETTALHEVFDREFRAFRNVFSNAVLTRNSWNSLVMLGTEEYRRAGRPAAFAGEAPSKLYGTLHANGYATTSIYENAHFGPAGPYVGRHLRLSSERLCPAIDARARRTALWGYCALWSREPIDDGGESGWTMERVIETGGTKGPHFTAAHIYLPGHTRGGFRFERRADREEFAVRYRERARSAAAELENLISTVKRGDGNSMVLVFGDHGPWLSRGMTFGRNPEFMGTDLYAVEAGIHPPETCRGHFDAAETRGWWTLIDIVETLIRCLAGEPPRTVLPERRLQGGWLDLIPEGVSMSYGDLPAQRKSR